MSEDSFKPGDLVAVKGLDRRPRYRIQRDTFDAVALERIIR